MESSGKTWLTDDSLVQSPMEIRRALGQAEGMSNGRGADPFDTGVEMRPGCRPTQGRITPQSDDGFISMRDLDRPHYPRAFVRQ
jgi:hypothetical protein